MLERITIGKIGTNHRIIELLPDEVTEAIRKCIQDECDTPCGSIKIRYCPPRRYCSSSDSPEELQFGLIAPACSATCNFQLVGVKILMLGQVGNEIPHISLTFSSRKQGIQTPDIWNYLHEFTWREILKWPTAIYCTMKAPKPTSLKPSYWVFDETGIGPFAMKSA